jgi:alpha-glucosidase (family GH31 glycosyl hydrolase)
MFTARASTLPFEEAGREGSQIMAPETPYVSTNSPNFEDMRRRGFLVRETWEEGKPALVRFGGEASALVDYTNKAAATYWHSLDRSDSFKRGARFFFLSGGEPEAASPLSWFKGVSDPQSHSHYAWANRYSLKWMEGFVTADRESPTYFGPSRMRNFLLVRAGMAGMGRFGGGLYTQDPSIVNFRVEGQARTQSALSGVDYYTTDVTQYLATWPTDGPFRNMYEAWAARNALLNLPLLVPDRLLDEPWLKQLLDFKGILEPYLYSIAHDGARNGDPVVTPLVYGFQSDTGARARTSEFLLGPYILVGTAIGRGGESLETMTVYVPGGRWYDYFNGEVIVQENGSEIRRPGKVSGYLMPSVLLREGAVVPAARPGRDSSSELAVKLFPHSAGGSAFTFYEDDGETQAFLGGALMSTVMELATVPSGSSDRAPGVSFTVRAREGSIPGSLPRRRFILEFLGTGNHGTALLDGQFIERAASQGDLELMDSGWYSRGTGIIIFKTPELDLDKDHTVAVN